MPEALKKADEVLQQGIQGITDLINVPSLINLDFADVQTVMTDKGIAHIGIGTATGDDKCTLAVQKAIESPLLETSIEGATHVLFNISGSISMIEVNEAATMVQESQYRKGMALMEAAKYGDKILVEEFIRGREVEVAVMGNESPVASVCGEIDSGSEFYDYDAKYITDTSVAYIPARLSQETEEDVRSLAVKAYCALGCRGLSRVDFFVTYEGDHIILNEVNTLPGFTSISMYPKLFAASGIPYSDLIDQLLQLALEACA
jgi:hypothetical protein